jgi:hypothetical protein
MVIANHKQVGPWFLEQAVRSLNAVRRLLSFAALLPIAALALAQDARAANISFDGFALLRATSDSDSTALRNGDTLTGQVQLGVDWTHSPTLGAHLHLLGRTDDENARRGIAGVVEGYVEAKFHPGLSRVRVKAGAFFLPTSRENVDSLWESPYTITPSALNSWLGEEFRPIGVDIAWFRGKLQAGATLFRGNDTFGALPVARGWAMRDHWILLGEWIPVDDEYFTSASAENDQRTGWSARGGWNGPNFVAQLTHIDNRSDARDYGELFNWNTQFDILSLEYTRGNWTVAAESGWGPTYLEVEGVDYETDIDASYLLVSRLLGHGRASARFDSFKGTERHNAFTAAYLWTPPGNFQPGFEVITSSGDTRVIAEVRYRFSRE